VLVTTFRQAFQRRRGGWRSVSSRFCATVSVHTAGPGYVDITGMSISNIYCELASLRILTDGYITRLPQSAFLAAEVDWPRRARHSRRTSTVSEGF
jgi:hypothetical protein